jgi:small-conductance mechanosensitive channel
MISLEWSLFGNTVQSWLTALIVAVVTFLVLGGLKGLISRHAGVHASNTANQLDDLVVATLRETRVWWIVVMGAFSGTYLLDLTERAEGLVRVAVVTISLLQAAIWGTALLGSLLRLYAERSLDDTPSAKSTIRFLSFLGRLVLWTAIGLLILANLGIQLAPLLAGVGVGGIAVALAVQTILGDLFASLSIALDKPFVPGDFIIVDDLLGTVEHIGIKTTRVKSLHGEELVFSNSDLLKSRIRNYKQMEERRIAFHFRIVYDTPRVLLEKIPVLVQEIVEAQPETRFDRAHFHQFAPSSLDFEVVYYMLVPGYNEYMDTQEAINLEMVERFRAEGITFAYPTHTVHMSGAVMPTEPVAAGGAG